MQRERLRNINPNHLHGCHPLDLWSYFVDSSFSLFVKKPKDPFPPISPRLLLLERILGDISRRDLPTKEYFSEASSMNIDSAELDLIHKKMDAVDKQIAALKAKQKR
jgi:hypothetical protein